MRLLMNAELSTTYADWKKVYDDHKWARDEANVKEILVGWCEEDQRIHVCFEVESMEVMEKFMEKACRSDCCIWTQTGNNRSKNPF